jgi:hypothetical protein
LPGTPINGLLTITPAAQAGVVQSRPAAAAVRIDKVCNMRLTARARATRRALLHRSLSVFAVVGVATLLLVAAGSKPDQSDGLTPPVRAAAVD